MDRFFLYVYNMRLNIIAYSWESWRLIKSILIKKGHYSQKG